MARKKRPSARGKQMEIAHAGLLRLWAMRWRDRTLELHERLVKGGASEDELAILDVARWLCRVVLHGEGADGEFAPHPKRLERLRAIEGLTRSKVYGNRTGEVIVKAHELVSEACESQRRGRDSARGLIAQLEHTIGPRFGDLEPARVAALLDRYEPGKGKRRKAGQPQGLAATGILSELNEDAGRPLGLLGAKLTPRAIDAAISDYRARNA